MKSIFPLFLVVVGCAGLATGCYTGPDPGNPPVATATGLNLDAPGMQDSLFASDALKNSFSEMELARLGMERAGSPELRLLAQRIFDDHANAQEDLRIIVAQQGILTEERMVLSPAQNELLRLSGASFDRAFLREIVQENPDEIRKFKAAARSAKNTELRDFAARNLPVMEEHLRIAENIGKMAALDLNINEPAGAQRPTVIGDPYYGGDVHLPHQFNEGRSEPKE